MMRQFLIGMIALCVLGTAMAVIAAFLGQFGPEKLRFLDSFSHFQLYYGLGFALALSAALMFRAWKLAAINATLIILAFAPLIPMVLTGTAQINDQPTPGQRTVLTFNLNYRNGDAQAAADYINGIRPDVLFLQELSEQNRSLPDLLDAYPHRQICPLNGIMSTAILSTRAPVEKQCLAQSHLASMVFGDGDSTSWRAISVHLHWPWPFGQWEQIDALAQDLASNDLPTLFAGDFNAAPWSRAVAAVAKQGDAKVASGIHLSLYKYYTALNLPLIVPIDHSLPPAEWATLNSFVGPDLGSDHRPVTFIYETRPTEPDA